MTLWRNAIAAAALVTLAGSASAQQRPPATPEQLQAANRAVAEF